MSSDTVSRLVFSVSMLRGQQLSRSLRDVVLETILGLEALGSETVISGVRVNLGSDGSCDSFEWTTEAVGPEGGYSVRRGCCDVETWNGRQLCVALLCYYFHRRVEHSDLGSPVLAPCELYEQCVRWVTYRGQSVTYQELRDLMAGLPLVDLAGDVCSRWFFGIRPTWLSLEAYDVVRFSCELVEPQFIESYWHEDAPWIWGDKYRSTGWCLRRRT